MCALMLGNSAFILSLRSSQPVHSQYKYNKTDPDLRNAY